MLEFASIDVSVFNLDYLVVSWAIKPTTETIPDYRFSVWRSNSHGGDFKRVVDDLTDTFVYKDPKVKLRSKKRQYFYKVSVYDNSNPSVEVFSDVETHPKKPDVLALEIIRRNDLLLKNFVGVDSYHYARRDWGQRCPECWDYIKQRKVKSNCMVCFNTGFIGGFHTPVSARINFNPSTKMIRHAQFEMEPNQTAAWMSNFPIVNPKDVIVEDGRKRWRVVNVNRTEKLRMPVHQVLQLTRINQNDVEYDLYIPETE
jgi:hypothetical protein